MQNKHKIDGYLAKAAEAESMASAIIDSDLKEAWLAIARQYRALAETRGKGETTAPQPSPLRQAGG